MIIDKTSNITAHYLIKAKDQNAAEAQAFSIACEQTIEMPAQYLKSDFIKSSILGEVKHVKREASGDSYLVSIAYENQVLARCIPQFVNVLFGNISLKNNILLSHITYSEGFLQEFPGPSFGIQKIRSSLGIKKRPLTATALKPMGSSKEELSDLLTAFALGGIDIIKDDHGLADHSFCSFKERVKLNQQILSELYQDAGVKTLYFPNICTPLENLDDHLNYLLSHDVKGILISPLLMGLDTVRYISQNYPLMIMAHPSLSGPYFNHQDHGIAINLFLGQFFRLIGADFSIYPNYGGRFPLSLEQCQSINDSLQQPWGDIAPAFPVPAGGMNLQNIPQMVKDYGEDVVYLMGGALLEHPENVQENTSMMVESVKSHFPKYEEQKIQAKPASSCELPPPKKSYSNNNSYKWDQKKLAWQEAEKQSYKEDSNLPFKGVSRVELFGKNQPGTDFDLRYFELKPGGFTSLEKHAHHHVIIGVQGQGELVINDKTFAVSPHDIFKVASFEVHQLRNQGPDPFGFYCIVDHVRDQPVNPS